jgi:hypothetical protein
METDYDIKLPYYYYINNSIDNWNIEKWGRIEDNRHTEITRMEDLLDGHKVHFELETEHYDRFSDVKDDDTYSNLFLPEVKSTKEDFEKQFNFTQQDTN